MVPWSGHVDRVVQPILNVAVQRRHEAVPQAALGEDQEADAVELVHGLHDAGEERLGDAVAVVAAAGQQQVFELVEGHHHRDAQAAQHLHQHLEQRQHQVLPAGPHLEVQLGEAVGEEVGQVGLVAEQDGAGEALVGCAGASGRPCCAPRCARCGWHDQVAGPLRRRRRPRRRPGGRRRRWNGSGDGPGQAVDAATASVPGPATPPRPKRRAQRPGPAPGTGRAAAAGVSAVQRLCRAGRAPALRRRTPAAGRPSACRRRAACR